MTVHPNMNVQANVNTSSAINEQKTKNNIDELFSDFQLICNDTDEGEQEVKASHNEEQPSSSSVIYTLYDGTWHASRTASRKLCSYLYTQNVYDVINKPEEIPEEYLYTITSLVENPGGGGLTTREIVDFLNAFSFSDFYKDRAEVVGVALCNKHTIEDRKPSDLFSI